MLPQKESLGNCSGLKHVKYSNLYVNSNTRIAETKSFQNTNIKQKLFYISLKPTCRTDNHDETVICQQIKGKKMTHQINMIFLQSCVLIKS